MSSISTADGISTADYTYRYVTLEKPGYRFGGDANVQPSRSLHGDHLRDYKDELHTIIDSWRCIYGKLPWAALADKYNAGNITTVVDIQKMRQQIKLKVKIY